MTPDEQAVEHRAEAALKTNAEAYRLAQEALDMRRENEQLRATLDQVGRALETLLLEWDGTIADPKLTDAYQGLKAYRAALRGDVSLRSRMAGPLVARPVLTGGMRAWSRVRTKM